MNSCRAAVIGAGRIGLVLEADPLRAKPASHAGMWLHHPNTILAALCDPAPTLADTAAAIAPEAVLYDNAAEMLAAERPDIVSIATHQDSHVELGLLAVENGVRAIVCEKPIASTVEDGERLVKACKAADVVLIVNHSRRFDSMLSALATDLENGLIGNLQQANGCYVYGLQSTGTHLIDTLRLITPSTTGDILWATGWVNERHPFHPEGDPCIDAVLGFANGAKAMLQSLDMKEYDCFDITLYGQTGKIVLTDRARKAAHYPVVEAATRNGFTEIDGDPAQVFESGEGGYFAALARHTIACLEGAETSRSTGEDSLIALRVLNAIRVSAARNGQVIEIATGSAW